MIKTFTAMTISCLLSFSLFAQSDYYDGTDGLNGTTLKSKLHTIIKGHKRYPYTSSSTDVWDILKKSDQDTTNPANVVLLYTGWKLNAASEYNGGSGWNREHVWAKSHGFPNESDTAYTDTHHLRPTDVTVNSARGNKDFDNGGNRYTDGNGVTDCYTDSDSWEPRDAVKGDIARIMFYMATRYNSSGNYDLELVDYTNTSSTPIFGKLSTLLQWNRQDPPDDFERKRNDVVYSYQNNRNPFTDHPEFVDRIYNSGNFLIEKAEALSPNQVLVTFNQPVDQSTAETASNYSIDKSAGSPVSAAAGYSGNNYKVLLTLNNALSDDDYYIVKINNVKSSGLTEIESNSIASLSTYSYLPVELTTFTASSVKNGIRLDWITATETNNYGFNIERKLAGTNDWVKIAFIRGNGSSNTKHNYTFTDTQLQNGISYNYRLKQIDIDGKFDYSEEVSVHYSSALTYTLFQNYPNPFNPGTTIAYELSSAANSVNLRIFDLLGREILNYNAPVQAGRHEFHWDGMSSGKHLSSGIYLFKLYINDVSVETRKMILMK